MVRSKREQIWLNATTRFRQGAMLTPQRNGRHSLRLGDWAVLERLQEHPTVLTEFLRKRRVGGSGASRRCFARSCRSCGPSLRRAVWAIANKGGLQGGLFRTRTLAGRPSRSETTSNGRGSSFLSSEPADSTKDGVSVNHRGEGEGEDGDGGEDRGFVCRRLALSCMNVSNEASHSESLSTTSCKW